MSESFIPPAILLSEVEAQPYPLLFATVSGAHLYGFASPDSDWDVRGVHLLPLRELLVLQAPRETVSSSHTRDNVEMDVVTHDARKFFALLLKHSGYALEQVTSPLRVVSSPEHDELCAIARANLCQLHARHYFGFAQNQWRLFEKSSPPRVKPLLYIYRVLLTGIHLMQSGKLDANLETLNAHFKVPGVSDLIAQKRAQHEHAPLLQADMLFYRAEYERLQTMLQNAVAASRLPVSCDARPALNDLLLRLRLGESR